MIVPTLHSNGTSCSDLLGQMEHAGAALMAAIKALEAMAPNGRDYYPQGSTAHAQAVCEHAARVARVKATLDEIMYMHERVTQAMDDNLQEMGELRPLGDE